MFTGEQCGLFRFCISIGYRPMLYFTPWPVMNWGIVEVNSLSGMV